MPRQVLVIRFLRTVCVSGTQSHYILVTLHEAAVSSAMEPLRSIALHRALCPDSSGGSIIPNTLILCG